MQTVKTLIRLHSAASDWGLNCLPVTLLGLSSLKLVYTYQREKVLLLQYAITDFTVFIVISAHTLISAHRGTFPERCLMLASFHSAVASASDLKIKVSRLNPSIMEIDHEIISMVILPHLLIQDGQEHVIRVLSLSRKCE